MTNAEKDRIDGQIFMMLHRAAERGDKCPSNIDISFAVGLSSPASATRILQRLEEKNLIEVYSGQCSRVVKICGSGKQTAGPTPRAHWRNRPENARRRKWRYMPKDIGRVPEPEPSASFQALIPVNRDPCPRCGTRRDIGCSHTAERLLSA